MKKLFMILVCLAALFVASMSVKAQEVTIVLNPGWNWISFPTTDTLDISEAFGSFTPMVGDQVKSKWVSSSYLSNGHWRGNVTEFYPGHGYMYKSNRSVPVFVTFNVQQQPASQVVVTTDIPVFITAVSAMGGGNVVSNDGTYIIVKGICWATHETPTSNDNYLEFGSGEGSFTTTWTDLEINTTYYVRAYAVTSGGTVYGPQQVFTTKDGIPVLTTMEVTDIFRGYASSGGIVIDDGGFSVTMQGVCWSTNPNPTINDSHTTDSIEIGGFTSSITGLSVNTLYYVRAYATNSFTTGYGEEKTFTTLEQIWENGISPGAFSVSSSQQVRFSQGNLQYIGSEDVPYWKFAEDQWEYFGNNGQGSTGQVDHDLFGWATSGYNHGAICYHPYDTYGYMHYWIGEDTGITFSEIVGGDHYLAYGGSYNLYDQTGQADWGYNAISNGGNQENLWYTLSGQEWDYVFNTRNTNSGIRYAKACVHGVNGVVLLPDDWDASIYTLNDPNGGNYGSNTITADDWTNVLEAAGAVFLPAAGERYHIVDESEIISINTIVTDFIGIGSVGYYWSASRSSLNFGSNSTPYLYSDQLFPGRSVRLVSPVQPKVFTIGVTNITETTASCGGRIVNSGVNTVTECGLCWGTEPNPTIDNNIFIANGETTGVFTLELTNLVPNTKYYIRAFATNSMGTFYGNEASFTCRNTPTGAVNGLFSVNSNSQVYFSQGNLQYKASANIWRFAENQWDFVGGNRFAINEYGEPYVIASGGTVNGSYNNNISSTYNGWIDLFGWGTSGYNHGANCYQPWSTSQTSSSYYAYGNYTYNLYDQTGQADWGYNAISNGENQENQWCTLTQSEWSYVFNTRATASGIRYAKARVNDVDGVILLPDDWSPTTYSLSSTNTYNSSFNSNTITAFQWTILENAGAVFLPAAGNRNGTEVSNVNTKGFYWTATSNGSNNARNVLINDSSLTSNDSSGRRNGLSVRLVRNAE